MISRLTTALPAAVLGAALFASSAPAQVRGMGTSAPAHRTGGSFRLGRRTGFAHPRQHRFFTGSTFLPSPYFDPAYDPDYEPVVMQAPAPQIVVLQPAQPPAPAVSPVEPLVLEYQNGQWVRISSYGQPPAHAQSLQLTSTQASNLLSPLDSRKEAAEPPPAKLPPAVLVFRDGHKEEIESYIIKGDIIYARADYWSTGLWTRTVPIGELDVSATLKLNLERGGKFSLPAGPNEIMIRP
jgi:hypothetical protein